MREEEKIFAGKLFDARTKELRDIKHKAHTLCQKFNTIDEYDEDRLSIIKEFIGNIGEKYYFQGPIQFNYGSHTFIGENFFSNFNLTVMDDARIYIGDNVMFGPRVSVFTAGHPIDADVRITGLEFGKEIKIGNNVWIGGNTVITPGVKIGDNVIMGAAAGGTKDIEDNVIAVGNPCKILRKITEKDKIYWNKKKEEYFQD